MAFVQQLTCKRWAFCIQWPSVLVKFPPKLANKTLILHFVKSNDGVAVLRHTFIGAWVYWIDDYA